MSSLFAMLSSQVQEIGRAIKAIEKKLKEARLPAGDRTIIRSPTLTPDPLSPQKTNIL
jgi:hypothetical protein